MPEFRIEVAARYFKRQFQKAVGKSVLKVLTELLTNADDSYRRLNARADAGVVGPITIEFDRRKHAFAVIDQAEGLDDKDMVEAFVTYGGESRDRSSGVRTRSLFGKGLRDVLFTQDEGMVRSIKSGRAFVCKFRWRDKAGNERPTVDVQPGPAVTPELRAAWGIAENGTRVQFRLASEVHVPQYDRLARLLENFYMLRVINGRADRLVALRMRAARGRWEERRITYAPPAATATSPLGTRAWTFEYEGNRIDATLTLNAYEGTMVQGEQSYEEREGGILVVDEDEDVLDLTLFGFDEEPAAARLFGRLDLMGAGELIRAKLNGEAPEELLTETRDGFDRRHPFYKELRGQIDPWLKPYVDAERERQGSRPSSLSEETRRRHERAFDRLNTLAKQLLGQSAGPGPGPSASPAHTDLPLEFRPARVTVRTGSDRLLQLLVNTLHVGVGTLIQVSSSDDTVAHVEDLVLDVPEPSGSEPTVVLSIRVEGLKPGDVRVGAAGAGHATTVDCSVVDEEVPDLPEGIALIPDSLELRDGERAHLRLFADLRVVGEAGEPQLSSSNPKVEILAEHPRWEPVTRFIVKASIGIVGRGKGEEALISARLGEAEAVAYVKIISKRQEQERRQGGMFKGYKFAVMDRKIQAVLDTEGYVVVNLGDPANRFHFGRDVATATRMLEEKPSSQAMLAELVLEECLWRAVALAYQNGKLRIRFQEDPATDMRNYVAQTRFDLGGDIHRLFVRLAVDAGS